jgi:hypothetical protein
MLTTNPFAEISAFISPDIMQGYVILMVLFVIAGTIIDMMHKKSAQYFFENSKKAEKAAKRQVSGGEKAGLAVQTLTNEVLTSSEFKNPRRRMSHLLTMYGFVLFIVTTAWLIFAYPTVAAAPTWLTVLWHLGAAMLCVGGYWFWFWIRVDVFAEGIRWYQLRQADMFILGLLGTGTFALLPLTRRKSRRQMARKRICPIYPICRILRRRQNIPTSRNTWAPTLPTWGLVSSVKLRTITKTGSTEQKTEEYHAYFRIYDSL